MAACTEAYTENRFLSSGFTRVNKTPRRGWWRSVAAGILPATMNDTQPEQQPSVAAGRSVAVSRDAPAYGVLGRPYVRWWWFASRISHDDIDLQIAWLREHGFGGVELSFVYPSNSADPVFPYLGAEWQEAVAYCAAACRDAGIGFDLTFGSLWPFGGSMVAESDASRTFRGLSDQRLRRSWESAEGKKPGFILNHLDRTALARYASIVARALRPAIDLWTQGEPPSAACFFCDSWEVHVDGLWTDGLGDVFASEFGYRVEPYFERIDEEPAIRYDYRRLVARLVLDEFYRPFTDISHEHGALSRVQCHGAPTDLIAAYSLVDVPETETLLFDPPFAAFASSAAAQAGARVVACESFTCLYGWRRWPGLGPHQGEEYWPDIRLTADAMFANGVNHVVWHGMPFRRNDRPSRFYASVHLGPDAAYVAQLPALNGYFAAISRLMQQGVLHAPLAVYQPLEDVFRKGRLPEADRRPSAEYHWEMQYVRFPEEARPYGPVWTSEHFLSGARVRQDGWMELGVHRVRALYVTSEYLHVDALRHMTRLAREGACIVLTRDPQSPGHVPVPGYDSLVQELRDASLRSLDQLSPEVLVPLVAGRDLPEYIAREVPPDEAGGEQRLRLFFAHPRTRGIRYPLEYRFSDGATAERRRVTISWRGLSRDVTLEFAPREALVAEMHVTGEVTVTHGDSILAECGLEARSMA